MDEVVHEQPVAELFSAALAEAKDDEAGPDRPRLTELRELPTPAVLDQAMTFTCSVDPTERELGLLVLQDLGPADESGRRPFSRQTVPHLRRLLGLEDDPWLLGLVVAGLGAHRGVEALREVVALAAHPHDGVRYRVAAVLPDLLAAAGPQAEDAWYDAVDALQELCRDPDPDVRYYALRGLVDPRLELGADDLGDTLVTMLGDEDDLVRTFARDYLISTPSHGPGASSQ